MFASACRLTRLDLLNENHGDRPDQNDVVLLITDGESNVDANLTIPEAELLKQRVSAQTTVCVCQRLRVIMDETCAFFLSWK